MVRDARRLTVRRKRAEHREWRRAPHHEDGSGALASGNWANYPIEASITLPRQFRDHLLKLGVLTCQRVASRRPKVLKLESRRHRRPHQGPFAARDQSRTLPGKSRNAELQSHSFVETLAENERVSGSIGMELQHFDRIADVEMIDLVGRSRCMAEKVSLVRR